MWLSRIGSHRRQKSLHVGRGEHTGSLWVDFHHRSSSRNRYANLNSAFRRFILEKCVSGLKFRGRIYMGLYIARWSKAQIKGFLCAQVCREKKSLPCALVIEESICPLLVLLRDRFWLFVPLEPCLILLVESPALALECFRRLVLLVCVLTVVE